MKMLSLKAKMTSLVSLVVAGMLAIMAFFNFSYFQQETKSTLSHQQFAMVSALAGEIDAKLLSVTAQLSALARVIPPEMLDHPDQIQVFLDGRPEVRQVFDNGILFLTRSGKLTAVNPRQVDVLGMDFSDREYFRETLRTGEPFMSQPFISRQESRHPILMIAAPVFDRQGRVAAVLGGSLDLLGENLLARIIKLRIGETGYFFLVSTSRTIILHPDPTRILQNDVPPGANPLFDLAMEGFEGSGETVTSRGLAALTSFKRLQTKNWILGANYPQSEAYAPIAKMRRYFFTGLAAILLLSTLTVWFLMRRISRPLLEIIGRAHDLATGRSDLAPLRTAARDEIGVLADAFNRMQLEIEQQKRDIREQKEFAENLLENAAAPIFVIDDQHRIVIWNRACEELTGIRSSEVKGTEQHWRGFYDAPRFCLADFVVSGSVDRLPASYEVFRHLPLVEGGVQAEGWRTLGNGRRRYLIFNAAPICNGRHEVIASIETLEDLTERKEAEKCMEQLAHFDTLTGLPNRALFFDRLEQGIAAADRYGHELALLYIDLDGFKAINDTGGHNAGDLVLVEVARRLEGCVRDCDTVARLGGDEFAVILGRVEGMEGARQVAARILVSMSPPLHIDGRQFSVGVSVGITLCPSHGNSADLLLRKADAAMYRVKAEGKNRYRFFSEGEGAA